jgi:predicted O-methyltransferase YrrM
LIKKILLRSLGRSVSFIRRRKARKAVDVLVSHQSKKLNEIGRALQETIFDTVSPDEKELIRLIEHRRTALNRSKEEIQVVDYGAGKPGSDRTSEEMMRGVRSIALVSNICQASAPEFWATLLFKMVRTLKPSSCVELGTCLGISASYQAAALRLNGRGRLLSLEGSAEFARIATETLCGLDLDNAEVIVGPFHETLKEVFDRSCPIDYFFNDGHHDHDAVLEYFNAAFDSLTEDAVVIFDDISWSPGMRAAWNRIECDSRVAATVDLRVMGIALIGSSSISTENFRIHL